MRWPLNRVRTVELIIIGIVLAFHAVLLRSILTGATTLTHDNIAWNYPAFTYYFSELSQWRIPIYNFFSRFGEPFSPLAAQMRFFDPFQSGLGLLLWKIFPNKWLAFNWFHYLMGVLQCGGMYLYLRGYTKSLWIRAVLLIGLLFTSTFLVTLRQDGILNQFLWVPFIAYILREKFVWRAPTWRSSLLLGLCIGASFQSYFFVLPFLFLIMYFGITWLVGIKIEFLSQSVARRWQSVALVMLPALFMSALNLVIFNESKNWVFPARSMPLSMDVFYKFDVERLQKMEREGSRLMMSEEAIKMTGSASRFWDFIQVFTPYGNSHVQLDKSMNYGDPSEAYIYLGLLPLALGFLGIALVRNREDWLWLNMLCLFFLIGLGHDIGLTTWLGYIFPPMNLVRNTIGVTLYTQFGFFYFVVLGLKKLDEKLKILRD